MLATFPLTVTPVHLDNPRHDASLGRGTGVGSLWAFPSRHPDKSKAIVIAMPTMILTGLYSLTQHLLIASKAKVPQCLAK